MFCTVIGKRRSFRFIISPFTAESPPERTEYFGIVSRPPTRECGSKGQVSSPKRNHAARKLRVIFGLMPALFFICFAKIESRLKCKTEKSCAWSNGFYIRASIDPWPKIRDSRIFAAVRTCWGVPSPDCVKTPVRGLPQTQIFCFLQKNRHKSKRWFCLYAWIAFTRHSTPSI